MSGQSVTIRKVVPLLLGSGFCALAYQIAWFREFRLVFGASTAASAAVLAIFMGGIGIGGFFIGRRVDRHPRPLVLYAMLEAGIALFTLITPNLLGYVRWLYIAMGGTTTLGTVGGAAVRLVLAALVLAVPTILMGGTLPAAARAVESDDDPARRRVGLLYGVNTLGAVTGCMVVTFFMLEVFGTTLTLRIACLLNLLIAVLAYRSGRALDPIERFEDQPTTADTEQEPLVRSTMLFTLTAASVVGFAFFLMEIVWFRMLGPILGGTVFTFGLILAVALLGIGLGGAFYSVLMKDRPASLTAFAYTCLLEAAAIAFPLFLGDHLAIMAGLLRPLGAFGFAGHVGSWVIISSIVILPAAFIAGVQFPVLIALLGRGRRAVGRQVGLVYLFNTMGAIVGSLAGGFGLIPWLSAPGCWRLVTYCLLVLGLAAIALSLRSEERWQRLLMPIATAAFVALMATAVGPTAAWRHGGIGAGRAPLWQDRDEIESWKRKQRSVVVWEEDGVESSVALSVELGYSFIVNGKNDGNATYDAPTQVMLGILGAILHPEPTRAAVIGLGTGSSAGWLAALPSMERVDVFEIEPAIEHIARVCAPVNHDALNNPKLHLLLGDAREALLTSGRKYDVIASEPSNPYRAGIASLFTAEYYRAVSSRLRDRGIFVQWVQAYDVDVRTLSTIYATLTAVFPYVETWQIGTGDLAMVASHLPIDYDIARLRARIAEPVYRAALAQAWHAIDFEGVIGRFVAGPQFALQVAEGGLVNTDDMNHIEFGFARTLGGDDLTIRGLREVAHVRQIDRPAVRGEIDWDRVIDGQIATQPTELNFYGDTHKARVRAFQHFDGGRPRDALAVWSQQSRDPIGPAELALVALGMALEGEELAHGLIEKLRAYQPLEADAITGILRAKQHRYSESLVELERALHGYRSDPWPSRKVMLAAMAAAEMLVGKNASWAPRVLAMLDQPFAVASLDADRTLARLRIAARMPDPVACVKALEAFEPYVPWDQTFLRMRLACYERSGDSRAGRAAEELVEFLESSGMSILGADLGGAASGQDPVSPAAGPTKPAPSTDAALTDE